MNDQHNYDTNGIDDDGERDGETETETEKDLYGILDKRNIEKVVLGDHEFDTWYGNAVYFLKNEPQELAFKFMNKDVRSRNNLKKFLEFDSSHKYWLSKLYVCDSCFKYTDDELDCLKHRSMCKYKIKLPGRTVYKDDSKKISIRKVKGKRHKLFCQNLCLFAKMFLNNKSVFFSLDHYDFYMMYGDCNETNKISTNDTQKSNYLIPKGFFSRELLSWDNNNLACILIFPPFQRQKLGQLLISFSYELSRFESLISGPEHPLSEFGEIGYLNYWSKYLAREFLEGSLANSTEQDIKLKENDNINDITQVITLEEISIKTGFRIDDILMALEYMGCLAEKKNRNIYKDYELKNQNDIQNNEKLSSLSSDSYDVVLLKGKIQEWASTRDISRSIIKENLLLY